MLKHCINSLFYNLEQTSRICRAGCEKYFESHGLLSFDEFIILDMINCYPDICQRDLAKLLLKGASHISKYLAELENKQLIQRVADKKGNRLIKKIKITPSGLRAYSEAEKIALNFSTQIENTIGKNNAIECSQFLDKIKQSVTSSIEINFD